MGGALRGRRIGAYSTTGRRPAPTGQPWSERKKLVWWDSAEPRVDGSRHARLHEDEAATITGPRLTHEGDAALAGDKPFICIPMASDGFGSRPD